jgi:hypothetical protein
MSKRPTSNEAGRIRLWTVQPVEVWRKLKRRGCLAVDNERNTRVHESYEWLVGQLKKRLPGYRGNYPWWAYLSRPDLRRVRHEKYRTEDYCLLELLVPKERVMVFPAWAWDAIFYGHYLSLKPTESETWHRRLDLAVPNHEDLLTLPQPWLTELYHSWELLFSPRLDRNGPRTRRRYHANQEAVFEVLELGHVQQVQSFRGTRS